MTVGFSYRETLSGTYHWLDDPFVERSASLSLNIVSVSVPDTLRDRRLSVTGALDLEGFAQGVAVVGSVGLKLRERRIPYDVSFRVPGGASTQAFRLLGEKDLHPALMEDTLALLPLSIFDERGYELGRARLRSPLSRAGLASLLSLRFRWFEAQSTPTESRGREAGAPAAFAEAKGAPLR